MNRKAVEKVSTYLNSSIGREEIRPRSFFFRKKFLFYDSFNRGYSIRFSRRYRGYLVRVSPSRVEKKLGMKNRTYHFLVKGEGLFRFTDPELISSYFKDFLKRRDYPIEKLEVKKNRRYIYSDGHKGIVEITKLRSRWKMGLRDDNPKRPYFCSPEYQYIFYFHPLIRIEEKPSFNGFLQDYQEAEIKITSSNPINLLKTALYGFRSPNLRAFYSNEGLFPELKHAVRLTMLFNFAGSVVNASILVRVAEKLKGNTWYILAAGALAFLRVPAEIRYMRRALGISRHLPSPSQQEISESEEFKADYESRPTRIWRNFEKAFTGIFRGEEYLPEKMETYRQIKPELYQEVLSEDKKGFEKVLKEKFRFNPSQLSSLHPFINELIPFNEEEVMKNALKKIEKLEERGVLKKSAIMELKDYARHTFPDSLKRYTCSNAYKIFNDAVKRAERPPTKEEIHSLVKDCRQTILPFRYLDLFLFISLFGIGYAASYSSLPNLFYPFYYLLYGAVANIIVAAISRIDSQVCLQYLFRELENDPAIRSAGDVWGEYNSHLMRLWALFTSLGLVVGVGGRLLSSFTYGISRFFVEGLALFCYLKGLNEWFQYYYGLEKRSQLGEED